MRRQLALLITTFMVLGARAHADAPATPPAFDAALAERLGADEHGMRHYVLVILKTGPTPLPKGDQRTEMFKGHFENMQRLAAAGKLVRGTARRGRRLARHVHLRRAGDRRGEGLDRHRSGDSKRRDDRGIPQALQLGGAHARQRDPRADPERDLLTASKRVKQRMSPRDQPDATTREIPEVRDAHGNAGRRQRRLSLTGGHQRGAIFSPGSNSYGPFHPGSFFSRSSQRVIAGYCVARS